MHISTRRQFAALIAKHVPVNQLSPQELNVFRQAMLMATEDEETSEAPTNVVDMRGQPLSLASETVGKEELTRQVKEKVTRAQKWIARATKERGFQGIAMISISDENPCNTLYFFTCSSAEMLGTMHLAAATFTDSIKMEYGYTESPSDDGVF